MSRRHHLRALCERDGSYKGLISDEEIYEQLKNGEVAWKPHIKSKLAMVEIPFDLFMRLMEIDLAQTPKEVDYGLQVQKSSVG